MSEVLNIYWHLRSVLFKRDTGKFTLYLENLTNFTILISDSFSVCVCIQMCGQHDKLVRVRE